MKICRRLLSLTLALLMLFSPVTVMPVQAAEPGSPENPIRISTESELYNINYGLDKHYVLTADITLTRYWESIGYRYSPFTGTLDGNWHTISNVNIEAGQLSIGFFGCIGNGAEIRNLQLLDINIEGTSDQSGAAIGGLVGLVLGGTIENCVVQGSVSGVNVGGLAGYVEGGTITQCFADVNVKETSPIDNISAGGLVGTLSDESGEESRITNSYAMSRVSGYSAGGLAGVLQGLAMVDSSYAIGPVEGANTGGLIGTISDGDEEQVTNSYYDNETTGQSSSAGGEGLSTSEMKSGTPFSGWDESIWHFTEYEYPSLFYQVKKYRVTYDLNGVDGTAPTDTTLYCGFESVTPASADGITPPEGKGFKEWNTLPDGSGTGYTLDQTVSMPPSDLTLYAIWDTPYTVTYNLNAGTSTAPLIEQHFAGDFFYLPTPEEESVPEGKQFMEWNTSPDGSGESFYRWEPATMPAANLTLYAIWEIYQDGSEEHPFLVSNYDDLYYVSYYPDWHYRQTADIILPDPEVAWFGYPDGCNWRPIGDADEPFTGSYDGCGFTISNLVMDTDEYQYAGLFGYVGEGAELKNINLVDVNIDSWEDIGFVGAVAGYNEGTISNCTVNGSFFGAFSCVVGGIVGINSGTIADCTASGSFTGVFGCSVAGIAGINAGEIINSGTSGTYYGMEACVVGGIVGSNMGTIAGCAASGFLPDGAEYIVGGIAGNNMGTITGCTDITDRAPVEPLYFVTEGNEGKLYIGNPREGGVEADGLAGWTYDKEKGVLTLDNLIWKTFSARAMVIELDPIKNTLTIQLAPGSENTLMSLFTNRYIDQYACGLEVLGNLIIDGTGTLTVQSGIIDYVTGIAVGGNLQINGGTINAIAKDAPITESDATGIYVGEAIKVNGGTLTATAGDAIGFESRSCGISATEIIISGGTVTASAGAAIGDESRSTGISAFAADVSGGTMTIAGDTQAVLIWGSPSTVTVDIALGYKYWTNTIQSATGAAGPVSGTATPFVSSDTYKYIRIEQESTAEPTPTPSPSAPVSSSPSTLPSYNANVSDGSSVPVKVNTDTGSVSLDLNSLAERLAGGENTVVSVPSISGISSYTAVLPAASLSGSEGTMTLSTAVGSVTIPGNMLTGTGLMGDAGISIGSADTSSLPESIQTAIGSRPLISLNLTMDGKPVEWSNPNAPVTVSIPYTPTADELTNPESIIIWYIDGSGNLVTIPNGRYDPTSGTVTFSTTHFSDYAVVYRPVYFNDVTADAWYYKAVSFLAAREITTGTGNGNYSPHAALTRGDFMVFLMRAYGISPDTDTAENFADAGNTYYTGYLAAAKRLGLSNGVGDNQFAPKRPITRQEMFTLLYNTLKLLDKLPDWNSGKKLSDFSDASGIASWAITAVTRLLESGIISGSSGKLSPSDIANRAEMTQVLYNLLNK